jgi:hypothetical protein
METQLQELKTRLIEVDDLESALSGKWVVRL